MRLSELKSGEKGIVVKVLGHGGFRKRIVEMGFVYGKTVEVLHSAPLKDPVKYRIMDYVISLRRQEAEMIEIISEQEYLSLQQTNKHNELLTALVSKPTNGGETTATSKKKETKTIHIAMVGNPNSGKTSLFNRASGSHEHVGNYSGVTVDAKVGHFEQEGYNFKIIDLPGTYSLSAYSPEEMYVRKHIIDEVPDFIINVVDSSNLERNLYLTTQLIDMDVPMVVALNMYDELEDSGRELNLPLLSKRFGVPMVPTVAKKGRGIEELFHTIITLFENSNKKKEPHIIINHGTELEQAIQAIQTTIEDSTEDDGAQQSARFKAIKLLENDEQAKQIVRQTRHNYDAILNKAKEAAEHIRATLGEDCESAITNAKYHFIDQQLDGVITEIKPGKKNFTERIDDLITHRIWGFPIFFLFMYLMFETTFTLGGYPMEWIEWLIGELGDWIGSAMSDGPLKDLIVDGIIAGVGGVIVFLPNILILYFFISLMEDSGYMARAAFIMDKVMQKMGLHGKSFIPLIMGFGCNVPAIMATRTIENRKVRLITMLVNPFMSCSARLPIYLLFVGVFFPKHAGLMMLLIYIIGILLAVIMARVFSKVLGSTDHTPFVMELPPYRIPTSKSIGRHTWEKGVQYLKKMGGIIMIASIIIWFLGYYPQSNTYETVAEQQENSYIGQLGKAIEPAIEPLGFDWKLGIGLLTGVGAKELVVSTLGVLYVDDSEAEVERLAERIPITPLVAFCYMLFSLIYFPCVAALAAIKNESGSWKWAIFAAVYTTALAWIITFAVYRIGSLIISI